MKAIFISFAIALAATSSGFAAFLDKDVLVNIDPASMPEVIVNIDGADQRYRALGDMLIPSEEAANRAFSGSIWPNGQLVFAFDPSIPQNQQQQFWSACSLWENKTPIHCVQRTAEKDYILVQGADLGKHVAGLSVVGWHKGPRSMQLAQWDQRTLVHEIGHAIGKAHEHQRSDAATYLTIQLQNVVKDGQGNLLPIRTRDNGLSIDFHSVMFYWKNAFAADPSLLTIVLKEPYYIEFEDVIGETDHPSDQDLEDVRIAYGQH